MAKALTLVLTAALLASIAFAQCTSVTNNVYRASACAGYTACATTLCTCAGNAGTAETCLSASTANCSVFTDCTWNFFKCLDKLADTARSNSSDPCNSWAVTLHAQLLTATVSNYNGSSLQDACASRACELKNKTSLGSACSLGTNASLVCKAPQAPTPPPTTPSPLASIVYAVRATLRLTGNWSSILADPVKKEALRVAIKSDLAGLLAIEASFIEVISLLEGSLVVDFAVKEGSNASVSQLTNRVNAASTSTTWLAGTQAYATANGGPTGITATVTVVTTTVAGGPTPGSPSGTTSSAASVSAAFVAVAALLALVF